MGNDNREIRRSVSNDIGVIEGVAQGGQPGEGAGRENIGDGGAARTGDVQVRDGASGDSGLKDGNHLKMEGQVQGHRVGRYTVESFFSGD